MSKAAPEQDRSSTMDRYITLALLILVLGASVSALRVESPIPTVPGAPLPEWRVGVLAGLVFLYGFIRQVRFN